MRPAELGALQALLAEKRDALLPAPPELTKRQRHSEAGIDEISAWMEECDQVDALLNEFLQLKPDQIIL